MKDIYIMDGDRWNWIWYPQTRDTAVFLAAQHKPGVALLCLEVEKSMALTDIEQPANRKIFWNHDLKSSLRSMFLTFSIKRDDRLYWVGMLLSLLHSFLGLFIYQCEYSLSIGVQNVLFCLLVIVFRFFNWARCSSGGGASHPRLNPSMTPL